MANMDVWRPGRKVKRSKKRSNVKAIPEPHCACDQTDHRQHRQTIKEHMTSTDFRVEGFITSYFSSVLFEDRLTLF